MSIPSADKDLVWRYTDNGVTGQQWAVRRCQFAKALELWTRESDDLPGTCIILPLSNARFLASVLQTC